jgi:hypothetical protein
MLPSFEATYAARTADGRLRQCRRGAALRCGYSRCLAEPVTTGFGTEVVRRSADRQRDRRIDRHVRAATPGRVPASPLAPPPGRHRSRAPLTPSMIPSTTRQNARAIRNISAAMRRTLITGSSRAAVLPRCRASWRCLRVPAAPHVPRRCSAQSPRPSSTHSRRPADPVCRTRGRCPGFNSVLTCCGFTFSE